MKNSHQIGLVLRINGLEGFRAFSHKNEALEDFVKLMMRRKISGNTIFSAIIETESNGHFYALTSTDGGHPEEPENVGIDFNIWKNPTLKAHF